MPQNELTSPICAAWVFGHYKKGKARGWHGLNSIKKAGHQGAILPKGRLCPGMAQEKGPQAGHARGPEIYFMACSI